LKETIICFSPTGTSKACSLAVAKAMKTPYDIYDVTLEKDRKLSLHLTDALLVISFPVYAGRVPSLFKTYLENNLKCEDCIAIAIATYGNRDFDDALVEIEDILKGKNVTLIGSASIVAEHSFSNKVGFQRPNIEDFAILDKLAVHALSRGPRSSAIGNRPYRTGIIATDPPYMSVVSESCTHCGICEQFCPTGAIANNDPVSCIHCCACVKVCPNQARSFVDSRFLSTVQRLEANCQVYRKSELFID
jgi:ferredoxin